MHSIKITAFSCVLLFSYTSYSSAPAQQPIDSDELEIPKIYLVPKKVAQGELELATKNLRSFVKESQNKDQVKKVHQVHCALKKHWASWKNAQQYIDDCGQQEISQGLRDEVQIYQTLYEQQVQERCNLINQAKGDPRQMWSVFCLENRQKSIYCAQVFLLRIKNEELIKEKEAIRLQHTAQIQQQDVQIHQQAAQIQQQAAQIHQQAAQINQLRALLEQQEPGEQQIDASGVASQVGRVRRSLGEGGRHGLAEREGMPHQLPSAPGGIK